MRSLQVLNNQPPEKPVQSDGAVLDVHSIFPTIQGEGPFAGRPAVFVRMAGCNIICPGCDTEYTAGRHSMSVKDIYSEVRRLGTLSLPTEGVHILPQQCLTVITGGEPFRQPILPLISELLDLDGGVQVETNGTLCPDDFDFLMDLFDRDLSIICSPKTASVNEAILTVAHAFKYVVEYGQTDPDDGLPTTVLGRPNRPARPNFYQHQVYVQPADSGDPVKNAANTEEAVRSCRKFGYTLSLQLHKILGLD